MTVEEENALLKAALKDALRVVKWFGHVCRDLEYDARGVAMATHSWCKVLYPEEYTPEKIKARTKAHLESRGFTVDETGHVVPMKEEPK